VQAGITECSTYAVVCRLKSSPPYIITPNGGSFNLPEYPNVCVTIPMNAVAQEAQVPLQIKVGLPVRGSGFEGAMLPSLARNSVTGYSFGSCLCHLVCVMKSLRCDCPGISYRPFWREVSSVRFQCSGLVDITTSEVCPEMTSLCFFLALLGARSSW